MTPVDKFNVIYVTILDRQIDSGDKNRESQAYIETTRAIIMTAHTDQVVSAS